MNHDLFSLGLYKTLQKDPFYKEQIDRILDSNCDITPEFLGFVYTYYLLSKLIPKDWTIIDLGCSYAIQSYFFRNHRIYVGVNSSDCLKMGNRNNNKHTTIFYDGDIESYIKEHSFEDNCFAICNFVPIDEQIQLLVRKTFKNLYIYYP